MRMAMSVVLAAALAGACGGGAAAPGDGSGGAPAGGSGGAPAALGAGGTLGTGGAPTAGTGGAGGTFACYGPGGTYVETNTLVSAGNCQGVASSSVTVAAAAAPTACHPLPIEVGACVTAYAYDATIDAQGTCAALSGTITWSADGDHGSGDVSLAYNCGAVVYHVSYDRP